MKNIFFTNLDTVAQELSDFHGVNITVEMLEEFSENLQDLFTYGHQNMLVYGEWPESMDAVRYALAQRVADDFRDTFNWSEIEKRIKQSTETVQLFDDEETLYHSVWLGTVFSCTPTGKVYTLWANSNVTEFAALCDELFQYFLDGFELAGARPYWNDSGDLFMVKPVE